MSPEALARKSLLGLESNAHDECFITQIHCIAVFYIFNVITDSMLYFLGEAAIKNQALMCVSSFYLIVHDNMGGLYMLFHTLTILIYSMAMWHIFYRVPKKYNLIAYQKFGMQKIDAVGIKVTNSMRRIDGHLDQFMVYD